MRKKIKVGIFLIACMSVVITACGKDKDTPAEIPMAQEEKLIESAPMSNEASVDEERPQDESVENMETIAESEVNEDLEESASGDDLFRVSMTDNVIYDDNGVTLTFDSIKQDPNGMYALYLNVDNHNSENKKLVVNSFSANINGISVVEDRREAQYEDNEGRVTSGREFASDESVQIFYEPEVELYEIYPSAMECLESKDMAVMTIGLGIKIAIGSDSEPFFVNKTLKTNNYSEQAMNELYGEFVTSGEMINGCGGMSPVDIYCKDNSFGGITAVVVNRDTVESVIGDPVRVYLCANGKEITPPAGTSGLGGSGIIVCQFCEPIDSIRKNYEIADDEALVISLDEEFSEHHSFVLKEY